MCLHSVSGDTPQKTQMEIHGKNLQRFQIVLNMNHVTFPTDSVSVTERDMQ